MDATLIRARLPKGMYVTGTDTGVGKTLASAALLHALRAHGLRAVGMKPVASGCERIDGAWRNEDALALQRASDPRPRYEDINPYALQAPLAPELAARDDGIDVALDPILAAHARLRAQADIVVVEGVGGWMAPLATHVFQADLVRALEVPVVLVVGPAAGLPQPRLSHRARDRSRWLSFRRMDRHRHRSGDGARGRQRRPVERTIARTVFRAPSARDRARSDPHGARTPLALALHARLSTSIIPSG
jgi:dethiobiotin synthase